MGNFEKEANDVIENQKEQESLIEKITMAIKDGGYTGAIIFCGNFLLGVNKRGECVACIPELFSKNGNILDQDSLNLCKKMDNEKFDTRFSYFSLKIGLEVFSRLTIQKQILLSADDKYVNQSSREQYFKNGFLSVPDIYIEEMGKYLGGKNGIKIHLENIVSKICDSSAGKINDFLLSEKYLVKRYKMRQKGQKFLHYKEYYRNLGENFTSCSLEIFHLLTVINEKKIDILGSNENTKKICILVFVPDACTSSAMQGGLAVSKINENFEIINITQTTTIEKGIMMITKVSKGGVERL